MTLPFEEVAAALQDGVGHLLRQAGLELMQLIMEEEVRQLAGERCQRRELGWSVHLFVPRWEKMNTPKLMSRTLKAIRQQLRRSMHADAVETGRWLGMVLKG